VIGSPGATIQVDPVTLTIADVMPVTGPEIDTLYEEQHIEYYSKAEINLDLAADELITVEYMSDGEIWGGGGDIQLRNVFDDGGIYFEEVGGMRTRIHTTAAFEDGFGGGIYMIAGSGGIVAGDLLTDTAQNDKISQPGEILLLTTNGGDIVVGNMLANGANSTQVSAISSGDLTVNGNAESINKQVDNDNEAVSKAILCLIAEGNIDLNGTSYRVISHGKTQTTADIRISAGENVYIGSAGSPAVISAEAKTSQQNTVTESTAFIVIHAGRNLYADPEKTIPTPGEIVINGVSYTAGSAYLSKGTIVAKAWPDLQQGVDSSKAPSSSDSTKTVWEDSVSPADDFFVKIEINNNEVVPLGEGPCKDCPTPPGLPPVPHIFWIVDDTATMSWSATDFLLDVLANDGINGGGYVSFNTNAGGTLTPVYDNGKIVAFEYTPPSDAVFTWDGVSDYAAYADTFTYKAKDAEGNESINTATVTLTVTNYLPTASGDS